MSEFKGTPGPWSLDSDGDVTSDSGEVAMVWYKQEQNVANARLIAAAPELLEALIDVTRRCGPNSTDGIRARAAIAKVLGQ